ncbi:MAG: rhodanese-like domain-containing protein [Chloroflexi bacterium]|nr:rhodanese-like domain-containing protein [Chloroflexota bacterium]MCI0816074.1 rhodanese-like domain-containing protein [Chloroflexota bacterium]
MATRIWRDALLRLIRDEAAQLVEVLPPAEYEEEHIEGAISIPLKNLDREAHERLDRDRPVVVY